jgi:sortase (surface protein transpeptidase)
MRRVKIHTLLLIFVTALICGGVKTSVAAADSPSILYVPLIGITSVPQPLALPKGAGTVTYRYAVKNFLQEVALSDVKVVDDTCGAVKYVEGDDNGDGKLDYSETWRYICTTRLSQTTQSMATATGIAGPLTATHTAYTTVIVGSGVPPPLVSIINITKVAYPLSLPTEGGDITFTYRVNNPGVVPLGGVSVIDDKCRAMSGKLGDTNGNNLLDVNEVWIYSCTTHLKQTTTNTVHVTAFANGLRAVGDATITVKVDTPVPSFPDQLSPNFPETGTGPTVKTTVWGMLSVVLVALIALFILTRKNQSNTQKKPTSFLTQALIVVLVAGILAGVYFMLFSPPGAGTTAKSGSGNVALTTVVDALFGWKYPVAKFPTTGSTEIAYSDIRDPGGIPQGLPVRLKIPVIGVDSAIEDALITPDGRMDVPSGSVDVAWFALGPHPGQAGSAVIGGHFGINNGVPFVFYKLDELKKDDKIYIVDDKGNTLAFIVRSISLFDRNADATTVFTSDDGLAHLNLITCEGIWNRVNDSYPQRRVVFTDAIPAEGAVKVVKTAVKATFYRTLRTGVRGADVTALQTSLIQKGFLTIGRGVVKGYFGALTRTAVARYQASVGLRATGVFDPSTRNMLIAKVSPIAEKPTLPSTAIPPSAPTPTPSVPPTPVSTFSLQALTQFTRNLYATPVDGLITSVLLISIVLILYQIIRQRF